MTPVQSKLTAWLLVGVCAVSTAATTRSAVAGELVPVSAASVAPAQSAPLAAEAEPYAGYVDLDRLPGADDPELRRLWQEGLRFEYAHQALESASRYERIAARRPDAVEAAWRIARNYWRAGDDLAATQREQRLQYFELSKDWAERGLEIDAHCAECLLWRFASLARITTMRGVLTSARNVATMAEMIERGIALQPTHRDSPQNTTLGNLYFASSSFYRVVPDSWWLQVLVGVRGNKERALQDIRKAVEISSGRLDYQVELGAVLLCLGESKQQPEQVEEGRAVLQHALEMKPLLPADPKEAYYARLLLEQSGRPGRSACNYSREGFIDVEQARSQL